MRSPKRSRLAKFLILIFVICVVYILSRNNDNHGVAFNPTDSVSNANISERNTSEVVLAVVACGDRLQETLTMIKSCLLFSADLKLIVVADEELVDGFQMTLAEWKTVLDDRFRFQVLSLKFPKKNADEWRKLFKPCASQRLFLPAMLTNIDSLIYVDTDTLFLSPIQSLWKHFGEFNSSQMVALALEHQDSHLSWYSRFAKHPFYGKLGVNSGVMLMNLTRMRAFNWGDYVTSVYDQWHTQLTWGDQDIINIIFHYHPEKLFLLDCDANYRPDQCTYGDACPTATERGARVLHGSRGAFHSRKHPAFVAVHDAFEKYRLDTDPVTGFLEPLTENLHNASDTNCGKLQDVLVKLPRTYLTTKRP